MRCLRRKRWMMAMLLLVFACAQEPSSVITPSGKAIKIGVIAPFSGSDFAKGEEGIRGVQTAIAMRPLLDNGDKVQLVIKDDQNDPAKAVQALAALTQKDRVAAVVTFSGSDPVLAMAEKADAYQTPIIAILATHPDVTKGNDYVSQICFDNSFQGHVAAFFVRDDLLVDRVAVFKTPASFHSRNLAEEFERQFTALGGEITDVVEIQGDEADLSHTLAHTLAGIREKGPELLYMPVGAKEVIAIMKAVAQMGWNPREMAGDGLFTTVLSQYAQHLELLNDLLATEFFHHSSQFTQFGRRARKAHKGRETSYAAMGVEGFSILLEAMNRCDDPTDRGCINRQIRSTTDFEGLLGKITIDAQGKAHRPVIINAIRNNQLKYIVKVY